MTKLIIFDNDGNEIARTDKAELIYFTSAQPIEDKSVGADNISMSFTFDYSSDLRGYRKFLALFGIGLESRLRQWLKRRFGSN